MRILLGVVSVLAACQPAPVGVQSVELAPDSARICASQCGRLGLELESVVIMANNVGCVCRPPLAPAAAPPGAVPPAVSRGGASSAAGLVAIMIQEQAAAAQQQQAQQHQQHQQQQQQQQQQPHY